MSFTNTIKAVFDTAHTLNNDTPSIQTEENLKKLEQTFAKDFDVFRSALTNSLEDLAATIDHFQYIKRGNYLYITSVIPGRRTNSLPSQMKQLEVYFVLNLPNYLHSYVNLIELELRVSGENKVKRFKELYLGNKLLFKRFLSDKRAALSCNVPIQGHRKTQRILDQLDLYFAQSDPDDEFFITIDAVNTDDDKLIEAYVFFCIILLALSKRVEAQGVMLFWRNTIGLLRM